VIAARAVLRAVVGRVTTIYAQLPSHPDLTGPTGTPSIAGRPTFAASDDQPDWRGDPDGEAIRGSCVAWRHEGGGMSARTDTEHGATLEATVNEDQTAVDRACAYCGDPLPSDATPDRKYCGRRCRELAKNQRRWARHARRNGGTTQPPPDPLAAAGLAPRCRCEMPKPLWDEFEFRCLGCGRGVGAAT
jgi:predicted nucleic acid-binding Zn ribbon protein